MRVFLRIYVRDVVYLKRAKNECEDDDGEHG